MASSIPSNAAEFSLEEILAATAGRVLRRGACRVVGVSTDSRSELRGKCFIALRGEKFDGHRFLQTASERGAACLLVESGAALPASESATVVAVDSTLDALGRLAAFHRQRWSGRLIAVAGSVGKTTTRCATATLASAAYGAVHSPPGNLNNRVGLPAVLLALEATRSVAVVELGTSEPGEVEALTLMARPDVAVLTKIAIEHSEGLGDLDQIEREEGRLLHCAPPESRLVVNADDERCMHQLAAAKTRPQTTFSMQVDSAAPYAGAVDTFDVEGAAVRVRRPGAFELAGRVPLLGNAGAYAVGAGVAAVESALGRPLSVDEWESALLADTWGEPGRLVPITLPDGSIVLDDTYNSSPESLRSSVQFARELATSRGSRLVLVLGEMRELGSLSQQAHSEIGRLVQSLSGVPIVAFGGDAHLFVPKAAGPERCFVEDAVEALGVVSELQRPGDVVLVKASRGLRAERIVAGLCQRSEEQT